VARSLSFEQERKVESQLTFLFLGKESKNFPFLSFLKEKGSESTTPDWFILILGKSFSVRNYFLFLSFPFS
jgi:hypothetical protein